MQHGTNNQTFTPAEVGQRYHCSSDKIIAMIRRGDFPGAIDVRLDRRAGKRARYLIPLEALQAFELARAVQPAIKATRGRKKTVGRFF